MSLIGNPLNSVAFLTDQFSGNGSTVAFTMSVAPANTASVLVAITGVVQDPSTYSVVGTTLTFSAAPPTGTANISVRYMGIPASGVTTTAYRTVTEFTATSGQTTFSVPSYTIGYIDVFRNGARLGTADYTASSGTTVVLAAAATLGDLIVTESFYVSSVLNAIPATAGAVNSTYLADSAVQTSKLDAAAVTQAKLAANVAGTGPAFSAVMASNQSVTGSVTTKIAFAVEQFDTNNNYDTSTYRFTPTVAGYYQFNLGLISNSVDLSQLTLYKNGSAIYGAYPSTTAGLNLSAVVYANGSTDYFEVYVLTSANASVRDIDVYSYFQGFLARAA
jgi:hypothetical protein